MRDFSRLLPRAFRSRWLHHDHEVKSFYVEILVSQYGKFMHHSLARVHLQLATVEFTVTVTLPCCTTNMCSPKMIMCVKCVSFLFQQHSKNDVVVCDTTVFAVSPRNSSSTLYSTLNEANRSSKAVERKRSRNRSPTNICVVVGVVSKAP